MKKNLSRSIATGIVVITTISGIFLSNMPEEPSEPPATVIKQPPVLSADNMIPALPVVVAPQTESEEKLPQRILGRPGNELILNRKREIASISVSDRSATKSAESIEPTEPNKTSSLEVNDKTAAAETMTGSKVSSQKLNYDTTLNSYVLNVIKTYKLGSNQNPYLLNTDYANYNGVTENLVYQGKVLLKAHPSGKRYSHCTGITFEVFFKAMQERNRKLGLSPDNFNDLAFDELYNFVMSWYVADGNKSVQNVAKAVEKYGIGRRITKWEEARAGDFIDLSRENNTGHTVVFFNWLRDDGGKIIGLNYWSSQESTGGISYKEEYFNIPNANGQKYGNVMANYLFIARVSAVQDYR